MKDTKISYEALALTVALIWGSTFIAQKTAMESMGPWTFTAVRFSLAVPLLLLLALLFERKHIQSNWRLSLIYGAPPGIILAISSILQQTALLSSYASKAGLITGLYVCLLPFCAVLVGYRIKARELVAAFTAISGLYFLSVSTSFTIEEGDFLLILSAFGWTAHILTLEVCLRKIKPITLALFQISYCALIVSLFTPLVEDISTANFSDALPELFYSGVISAGLAFGLQLLCQQHLSPNRVGLLFSMESLFALFFGWLLLGETFNQREMFGGALMLASLIIVRLKLRERWNN